ncbi:MAG: hypothetical protein LBK99_25055 [Opitutaceae bacterium]|jgi:hypothetical protein|nr:hypothetical protein [Opitutaceae bacterium]
MFLNVADKAVDRIGKGLAGDAKFPFHGAYVADAFGAFFEDRESFATETAAECVGGIERETALFFQISFECAADFSLRQRFEQASGESELAGGAEYFLAGMGEQVLAGVFE